jgi:hypothetical protein
MMAMVMPCMMVSTAAAFGLGRYCFSAISRRLRIGRRLLNLGRRSLCRSRRLL